MFWSLFTGNSKSKELELRVKSLEEKNAILAMALQSMNTQLATAAHSTQVVAKDVKEIQDAINSFVEQALNNEMLYSIDPTDGYEH
tara:strand:+ start:131 stop:388 length:258 start_codon:yes stop_codon:yes gene_type:complete